MLLKIARTHENAKLPARANPSDAGADIFFCPKQADGAFDSIRIDPGVSVVLPTGIKVEVPHGYMLEVKNKSGVASKRSLVVGACVIDWQYAAINYTRPKNRTISINSSCAVEKLFSRRK
jgi:dUTPase